MIKSRPCKVIDVVHIKNGKHGSAKKNVAGKDVITDKKKSELFNHHSILQQPNVYKESYSGIDVGDDFIIVMDEETGNTRDIDASKEHIKKMEGIIENSTTTVEVLVAKYLVKDEEVVEERVVSVKKD